MEFIFNPDFCEFVYRRARLVKIFFIISLMKKNVPAESVFPFLLFLAGVLLVQDLFLLKKKRSVFKRYSYLFYINMSLVVSFFF
ncbi:Uncharacterized protein GNX_2873 [Leptospira interrogans serovar Canicola]|nr:Uncharacterized protein GNX_2873 [Leptospira interrogans serovar Canicola]